MDKKKTVFIPFNQVDSFGDVVLPGCSFTCAPGIKILESHTSEDGILIITNLSIDECSIISTYGIPIELLGEKQEVKLPTKPKVIKPDTKPDIKPDKKDKR